MRVSQFMQKLLDLEQMEGGGLKNSLKPRPVDIGMLLVYAETIAAHDPSHPVSLRCPPNLPAALAEPDRVQQVLANLLSNARKYTPKGGQIEISAHAVRQTIEISVQDDGIGIPSEALPHVFEKFFRVNSPRHRTIPGSGIGLAICREIVGAHGGRIWVESEGEGRGTRFTFSLPMARVSRPRADISQSPRRAERRTPVARAQHALTAQPARA
jgi:signal transduction histidine kinase